MSIQYDAISTGCIWERRFCPAATPHPTLWMHKIWKFKKAMIFLEAPGQKHRFSQRFYHHKAFHLRATYVEKESFCESTVPSFRKSFNQYYFRRDDKGLQNKNASKLKCQLETTRYCLNVIDPEERNAKKMELRQYWPKKTISTNKIRCR